MTTVTHFQTIRILDNMDYEGVKTPENDYWSITSYQYNGIIAGVVMKITIEFKVCIMML